MWNATQTTVANASTHPSWKLWIFPALAISYLFTATMPVFYFALYRHEGPLRLAKRLQLLSLAAAIGLSIVSASDLLEIIGWRTRPRSVLTAVRAPWTISDLTSLLAELANVALILLLIALSRQDPDQATADIPASRMFSLVTKITVIAWGIWLAFNIVQFVLAPYFYSQLRPYALQMGRTPPPLANVMRGEIRRLLSQVCIFAAPYVVYRGRLNSALARDALN